MRKKKRYFFLAAIKNPKISLCVDRNVQLFLHIRPVLGRDLVSEEKNRDIMDKLRRQMYRLSQARVNDAVKLAFLEQEDRDLIDGMDLTALTEFKRAGNGAVEVKFIDRMKMVERMLELCREDPAQQLLRQLSGGDDETEQ